MKTNETARCIIINEKPAKVTLDRYPTREGIKSTQIKFYVGNIDESGLFPVNGNRDNEIYDLCISCYVSNFLADDLNQFKAYGFAAEFKDVFAVDLRRSEAMVKTLRKIEKQIAKLGRQPSQMAGMVKLVCDALKIEVVAAPERFATTTKDGWYSSRAWTFHKIANHETGKLIEDLVAQTYDDNVII